MFHPWLKNSNAKSPKRPTQTAIGSGVRPNGPTGDSRVAAFGRKPPSKIPVTFAALGRAAATSPAPSARHLCRTKTKIKFQPPPPSNYGAARRRGGISGPCGRPSFAGSHHHAAPTELGNFCGALLQRCQPCGLENNSRQSVQLLSKKNPCSIRVSSVAKKIIQFQSPPGNGRCPSPAGGFKKVCRDVATLQETQCQPGLAGDPPRAWRRADESLTGSSPASPAPIDG